MKTYGTTNRTSVSEWSLVNEVAQNKEFPVFNTAELVVGIAVPGGKLHQKRNRCFIEWVKRPQVGAGMVYVKCNEDGTYKSSVDKLRSR
jgi:aspartyl-tRNA synthetase